MFYQAKNNTLKKIISLTVFFISTLLSTNSTANVFDDIWKEVTSDIGITGGELMQFEMGGRVGVTGTPIRARTNARDVTIGRLFSIAPIKTESLGCSGMSITFGSLSILNGDQIEKFIQSIGPNLKGYVLSVALDTLVSPIANWINEYLDKANQFGMLALSSCQAAQNIVNPAIKYAKEAFNHDRVKKGEATDVEASRKENKKIDLDKMKHPNILKMFISNPVWAALKKSASVPTVKPISDRDKIEAVAMAEILMTAGGVEKPQIPDKEIEWSFSGDPKVIENLFNVMLCGDLMEGKLPAVSSSTVSSSTVSTGTKTSGLLTEAVIKELSIEKTSRAFCRKLQKPKLIQAVSCNLPSRSSGNEYTYEDCGLRKTEVQKYYHREGDKVTASSPANTVSLLNVVTLDLIDGVSGPHVTKAPYFYQWLNLKENNKMILEYAKGVDEAFKSIKGGNSPLSSQRFKKMLSVSPIPLYKMINLAWDQYDYAHALFREFTPIIAAHAISKKMIRKFDRAGALDVSIGIRNSLRKIDQQTQIISNKELKKFDFTLKSINNINTVIERLDKFLTIHSSSLWYTEGL